MTTDRSPAVTGTTATAIAPATVANVAVGFDVLGFAFDAVGDRVSLAADPNAESAVVVESITGIVPDLPTDPTRNTAGVALRAMAEDLGLRARFALRLHKGIPLGSGMGGSAASAVAAVVAANALLDRPVPPERLLPYALAGEAAASGAPHADNAAPCLLGGMTAVVSTAPPRVVGVPVPSGVVCVLVHPHLRIETKTARALLEPQLPLERHVEQSMRLSGFLVGCFREDLALIEDSMVDLVAGPRRASLIGGFEEARRAARAAGALAFAIAGSGPSVFAWVRSSDDPPAVESAIRGEFDAAGVRSDSWIAAVGGRGARPVEPDDGT